MNTYSDNQTGHLYVMNVVTPGSTPVADGTDYKISSVVNNMFTINIGGHITDTITKGKMTIEPVKAVKPIYYRRWKVNPMTKLVGNSTYYLYFYLENTIGFGINDRIDIAISYDATDSTVNDGNHDADDAALIKKAMSALKDKLNAAINTKGYGPIVDDFKVVMLDESLSKESADFFFSDVTATSSSGSWTPGTDTESLSKGSGTHSGKKYTLVKHEGAYKVTYVYDDSSIDIAVNDNVIYVYENPKSNTYTHNYDEIRIGAHPYEYDLTLSTYQDVRDEEGLWGNNKRRILPENSTNVRFGSGVIVKDMENFFMRNRADLYSLSPNFNASIINDLKANENYAYSMVNIHYAFSDNLGFSYLSEKDINIAVRENAEGNTTNGAAVRTALLAV